MKTANIFLILFLISLISHCKKTDLPIATIIAKNGLSLRQEPNINAKNLASLKYGDLITIINKNGPKDKLYDEEHNWMNVRFNNITGWAFGQFIVEGNHQEVIDQYLKTFNDIKQHSTIITFNSSPIPLEIKQLILVAKYDYSTCFSEGSEWKETLTLNNGTIEYSSDGIYELSHVIVKHNGTYQINNNILIIKLNPGIKLIETEVIGGKNKFEEKVINSKEIELLYFQEFHGYISKETLKSISNKTVFINRKDKYITFLEDETAYRIKCGSPILRFHDIRKFGYYSIEK